MYRLLLCTGNPGKLAELRALLPAGLRVLSLSEAGLPEDLPETGTTLEENALQKARHARALSGMPCVADDTGLEVDALDGAPGVFSARYAGPEKDPTRNTEKLLAELDGTDRRAARFRTVIALVDDEGEHLFEGVVRGRIADGPRGDGGFGYDPVFVPEGSASTFAEMDAAEKNRTSHRGRAVRALVEHLTTRAHR